MATQGKSSKQGRNKRSPSMVAYVAQGRLLKNKKHRIAKEEKRQNLCAQRRKFSGWGSQAR